MAYHGITINGLDLLQTQGLILLADLKIGAATPREKYVEIPGGSGALDLSTAPAGWMTYNNRPISGRLFKSVPDDELEELRAALAQSYHGQRVNVVFPTDTTKYFSGRFRVGELEEYGSGVIPFSMTADPWAYALEEKTVSVTAGAETEVTAENDGQRVAPTFTTSTPVTIAWGSKAATLPAGENQIIPGLILQPGENELTVTPTADAAEVTITWRERFL